MIITRFFIVFFNLNTKPEIFINHKDHIATKFLFFKLKAKGEKLSAMFITCRTCTFTIYLFYFEMNVSFYVYIFFLYILDFPVHTVICVFLAQLSVLILSKP
jgi:hypothetical protein